MSDSKQIDDGGPTFPVVDHVEIMSNGMSLRDWFAGQALAGWMSVPDERRFLPSQDSTVDAWKAKIQSSDCGLMYEYADAMLAARSVKHDPS